MIEGPLPDLRIPVVVAGGFLGAGKTTLVNHVLQYADGRRIVVFVNDFGDINIDASLIDTIDRNRISLKNGCVCCTLNDDLVRSLSEQARTTPTPDIFLIETSGVADPRQLRGSIDPLEAAGIARLDAQLYVLDVDLFETLDFDDQEQLIDHANGADLILLNKCDLAGESRTIKLEKLLAESVPHAGHVRTVRCNVDTDVVFGPSLLSVQVGVEESDVRTNPMNAATHQATGKTMGGSKGAHKHYASLVLETGEPLDKTQFERFVVILRKHCIRAKGFVRFTSEPAVPLLFDLVGSRASLEQVVSAAPATSRIVAIGEAARMDTTALQAAFALITEL